MGPPFPHVELKLAADGEVLARGPNVMHGYIEGPDAPELVIDADGWLHTGDLGYLDAEGLLSLVGRKKNLIANSYGDKVVPEPIEFALKRSPYIQEAVVVGDGRPFFAALLVPDLEALRAWAGRQGFPATQPSQLLAMGEVRKLYGGEVETANRTSKSEPILAWELLAAPFTIEGGEITPTQKVRRRVINDRYRDLIERLYSESDIDR